MRLFSLFLLFTVTSYSSAQFGNVTYNFNGTPGTQTISGPGAIQTPISNVTVVGATPDNLTNTLNASQWGNQGTIDTAKYYSITLTTTTAVSIPSVTLNALSSLRGTNTGPSTIAIRSSLDNFAADLGVATITPGTVSPRTFNLDSNLFGNLNSGFTVSFRIYGYNASNNGTNSDLGFLSTSSTDHGIIVPIATPVPEPTTLLGLSSLGLLGFAAVRRRLTATV